MKNNSALFGKLISTVVAFTMIVSVIAFNPGVESKAETAAVIVASSNSAQTYIDQANANAASGNGYFCANGVMSAELKNKIAAGGKTFRFAPGSYLIENLVVSIGSNTVFEGINEIKQPVFMKEMLYPDAAKMAVFETRLQLPSNQACSYQKGSIETKNFATNVRIANIALSGYTIIKLNATKDSVVKNVLVHNYRGTYPNGQWCNMGYSGATASFWVYGACSNILIENCQIQCSSHHGFAIHKGGSDFVNTIAKDITLRKVRALYCGNGQLKGDNATDIQESEARVPETNGHGYLDWSVAYDLCENQSATNVLVEDCYALEGWKCGFYTEPEDTGGHIVNLQVIRCRSDRGGQRTLIPGSNPRACIVRETENSNFFTQGGYYQDCISVDAERCGWLAMSLRTTANKPDGTGRLQLVNCGDYGSPIGFVSENLKEGFPQFEAHDIKSDGFWSFNNAKAGLWLYANDYLNFTNNKIITNVNQSVAPILIGYMERQQFLESRWDQNTNLVNFKYKNQRRQITNSSVTGEIYNLPSTIATCQIKSGSSFNGQTDPNAAGSNITLTRKTGLPDVTAYVNDNWGRAQFKVTFNSNKGTSVAARNAYDQNSITAPTAPKRYGFTFLGWYTSLTGGTKVIFPYKVSGNVTFYARWKMLVPAAPYFKYAKRTAAGKITLKWNSVKYAKGYEIYRSTTKYGKYAKIKTTTLLSFTNTKLKSGKTYYFKFRCYNLDGTKKAYSKYSGIKIVKA